MDVTDEVYLAQDPSRVGIIVKIANVKKGVTTFVVAWYGSAEAPTEHPETELRPTPKRRTNNSITGTVTGNVVQTSGNINGSIIQGK